MDKLIKVKPNSQQSRIQAEADGSLTVYLKSPPVDGKANVELIQILAKTYDIPKSKVIIKSGLTSRIKRVEIEV